MYQSRDATVLQIQYRTLRHVIGLLYKDVADKKYKYNWHVHTEYHKNESADVLIDKIERKRHLSITFIDFPHGLWQTRSCFEKKNDVTFLLIILVYFRKETLIGVHSVSHQTCRLSNFSSQNFLDAKRLNLAQTPNRLRVGLWEE